MFKALRGAAPSYGIVTQWVFDTLPAPKTTVTFNINFPEFSDTASFVSAFKAYQSFVRNAPNEMGMTLAFGASSDSALAVNLMGNYYGTRNSFNSLVQPLVAQFPGTTVDAKSYTNWTDVLLFNAQGLPLQTDTPDTVCRTLDCTVSSENIPLSPTTSLPKYAMKLYTGSPFNPFRSR
jgi:FAD/FMN-containing dehydrogenase